MSDGDFVGRKPELERLGTLLAGSARLVTLIGPGGIGKTRLAGEAVQAYRRARRRVRIYWVRLARIPRSSDVSAITDAVAGSTVDVDFSDRSAWDALTDTLAHDAAGRSLQTILVIDNCEHVLAAVGRIVTELLDAVPRLTILATSREPIGWIDEQLVQVPPLSGGQAQAFFRRRAELTGHTVAGNYQVALVDSICRHLNNNPLNIQLAAARLRRQTMSTILQDLSGGATDKRLHWQHSSRVGVEERHHGIGDAIAWSFELCTAKEQLLFERLSVFAAGYDRNPDDHFPGTEVGAELEAIRAVCAGPTTHGVRLAIDGDEIEDLLHRLVDQSLVSVHLVGDTVRYSLQESLRVFAQQRLREQESGAELTRLSGLHRRYYRDKIRQAAHGFGHAEEDVLNWATAAWDNLLGAIESSCDSPDEAVVGLQIATGLIALRIPFFKGSLREFRQWVERTLAATSARDSQPVELQVAATAFMSWVSLCQGMPDDAERMLDVAVTASLSDPQASADWRNECATDLGLPALVEFAWGCELMIIRQDVRAVPVLARAREKFRASGDFGCATTCELLETLAACLHGPPSLAVDIARRHLDNATRSGARWARSWAQLAWAMALIKNGDPEPALTVVHSALTVQVTMGDRWGPVWAIYIRTWGLARLIADTDIADAERADRVRACAMEIARLLGGVSTLRERVGVNNLGPFATETNRAAAAARKVLGDTEFAAAKRDGSMLRPERGEVTELALGTLALDNLPVNHPIRQRRPSPWHALSDAEQEVAMLAAAGWSNPAIAARRGSSFRTVDAQMAAAFQKLTINSRDDIPAMIPARLRPRVAAESARRPNPPRANSRRNYRSAKV